MSYAQLTRNEASSDYFTNIYDQNKTARYLRSGNRIIKVEGDPEEGDALIVQSVNAGTYVDPDIASFNPVFGPAGVSKSLALQFGPTVTPAAIGLNTTAILNSIPQIYNDGFTYDFALGRVYQTFEENRLYLVDASFSLSMDIAQAVGEVLVTLYLYDADLASVALLSQSSIQTQPFASSLTRGIGSLSQQVIGRPNPNSYFYVQLTATSGALPLTIYLNFFRFAITVL